MVCCCGRRNSGGPRGTRTWLVGRRLQAGVATAVCLRCLEPCQHLLFLLLSPPVSSSDRARGQGSSGTGVWARVRHGQVTPHDVIGSTKGPRRPPWPAGEHRRGASGQVCGAGLWEGPHHHGAGLVLGLSVGERGRRPEQFVRLVVRRNLNFSGDRGSFEDPPCMPGNLQ